MATGHQNDALLCIIFLIQSTKNIRDTAEADPKAGVA
jgi:hypothetical protein